MAFSDPMAGQPGGGFYGTRAVGSVSDLYPRMAVMQRIAGARGFALVAVRAQTAIGPGNLSVLLESPPEGVGYGIPDLVADHAGHLLSHLWRSPLPLRFAAATIEPVMPAECDFPADVTAGHGMAFPVQLGAMGNGYTVLFGVTSEVTADLCIDLHRKSVTMMREALKLEYSNVAASETLSEREIECLQMVGDGMKSEAIGAKLGLSVHTVNAYLGSATTKLDAVNRIQAIAKAIRLGLIG